MPKIHIIGGGTVMHVRPHLAISSPAYGTAAREIFDLCMDARHQGKHNLEPKLHLTRMAGGKELETNADIERLVEQLVADPDTKMIFMTAAMCDYKGLVVANAGHPTSEWANGKYGVRLKSRDAEELSIKLTPAQKVVGNIRRERKDIYAVGFKTTCGEDPPVQYIAGLNLLKEASLNLVLANDVKTRHNMVIVPEESRYHETTDRDTALKGLVDIALSRSNSTFTRSTVNDGNTVPWDSALVPASLRTVVNHCIMRGAYKPFRGSTVGHFACKISDTVFLTSIRKSNFNNLDKTGLVRVISSGPDSVVAYGAKPSVGGQSQRIIFAEHPEYDCIVHFHSPRKSGSLVPVASQWQHECGSHQCGQNTSRGLKKFGNLSAVFLDEHGPNIVFNRNIDPQEVIDFIEANFYLDEKTGGPVILKMEGHRHTAVCAHG